jgi:hypothetical protein
MHAAAQRCRVAVRVRRDRPLCDHSSRGYDDNGKNVLIAMCVDAPSSFFDWIVPTWPRYALRPVYSRTFALAWRVAWFSVVPLKSNLGIATALEPSAPLTAATRGLAAQAFDDLGSLLPGQGTPG